MSIKTIFSVLVAIISLTSALPNGLHALDVPQLKGRVNDYAGMLSPNSAKALEQKLAAFERETSNQVVLLTIPSLDDETIEGYAIKVAEAWKPGQKEKGNGVILILAKKEKKIRIEVGTGLQGALPDITSGQIIRTNMAPHLKRGDLDTGIVAGIDGIISATKGEFKATPADRKATKKRKSGYGTFILLLVVAVTVVAAAGSSSRTAGTLAGGAALPTAAAIGLGTVLWKLAILGILGAVVGFLISLLMKLWQSASGGSHHDSGWGGGPFFGGGFGGGSSGGGDSFEGGGGDFDGGGASDDW